MPQPLSPADVPRVGLRERKKLKTRLAIQEHALRLFREQGYQQTTIEQIADAAEVSPSTFFRYFPTKEDVVLFDAVDPWLVEAFQRQPPELSPIAALRNAIHEVFESMPRSLVEDQRQRGLLVYHEPDLQAAWVADLLRTAALMATLLADRVGRHPNDLRIRIYTGALMGAMMAAMLPAMAGSAADFVADLDVALDLLEGGLQI